MAEGRFHKAAQDGNLDILRVATRRDLNAADEDGMTPTIWAAYHGNLEALRMILGRGGDENKPDITGFTPLHHAAKNGHINIVSFLINYGCNIWCLDNDFHTALDIAGLYDRVEIVKLLDSTHSRQQQLNPKVVQSYKEKATREAEQNIKKYEKRQKEAIRIAEKESRRIAEANDGFKAPGSKPGLFKTITLRLKGTKKFTNSAAAKKYSEMTNVSTKRGVAKKIMQKRNSEDRSNEFKVSEMDEQGNRTLRSLSGVSGVAKDDVLYMTNRETDGSGIRPALKNVFPGINGSKWKSESDILDAGIDVNEEEEDNAPGLFNIGIGKISFLHTKHGLAGTFNSMHKYASNDMLDSGYGTMNGLNGVDDLSIDDDDNDVTKRNSSGADSIGTTNSIEKRVETIPWNPEDVDSSDDDDDDESEYSALFRFLETCGLSQYTHLFTKEDIELEALMLLTEDDLEKLGLKLGPRKVLRVAIQRRKDVLSQPAPLSDTML